MKISYDGAVTRYGMVTLNFCVRYMSITIRHARASAGKEREDVVRETTQVIQVALVYWGFEFSHRPRSAV